LVGLEAEPVEVIANGLVIVGRRALAVGIVDPQDEGPAMLPCEQEIVQGRANIADVQAAGR
jgi:hypothetical protein